MSAACSRDRTINARHVKNPNSSAKLKPQRRTFPMNSTTRSAASASFLRRDPADVAPWAETCGQIRPLIEERDGAAAEVHQVEIHDAKLHYHAKTDEIYYIIDGTG